MAKERSKKDQEDAFSEPKMKGYGYRRDPEDGRDWSARSMLGAARSMPAEAMALESAVRGVLNQGQTNSCVGHAIALVADTRLRHIGVVKKQAPSALAIYSVAREIMRNGKGAIVDEGCWPRAAMKGLRDYGAAMESDWPLDPNKVNADLPWGVLQRASAFKLEAFFRIDSVGQSRVEDIAHALCRGYPIVFGTDVDGAFKDYTKGIVQPAMGKNNGGHMMSLIGYTTTANGRFLFRGVNSWGTGWGDHGYFWCDERFVLDPRASDFYVCQVSP